MTGNSLGYGGYGMGGYGGLGGMSMYGGGYGMGMGGYGGMYGSPFMWWHSVKHRRTANTKATDLLMQITLNACLICV